MKARRTLIQIWLFCAAMLPAVAQAQFAFTLNADNTITITGYTGLGGAVTIPGTINGVSVASIGTNAFAGCTSLNSAGIPNSVTSIGSFAFAGCTNLFSVFFGSNAPSADPAVFTNDGDAFVFYLPGTSGWSSTFAGIQTVLLPYTYTASNGVIAITGYTGAGGAVSIPGMIGGLPVISIGANAFSYSGSVIGVTIPDNVVNIWSGAFYSCTNLTSVAIGSGVTNISTQAFFNCASLTNVTFGNGVTTIGNSAFQNCSNLASVTMPAGINGNNGVGSSAFSSCLNLKAAYFQGNAPYNNGSAFSSDSGAVVYYLPGTTGWGSTFGGAPTALYNPPVPYNYTTNNGAITITAYTGSGGAVTIPGTIYDVGASNFLPVTSIGTGAFAGCSGLSSVSIPGGVTTIGNYAFQNCSSLSNASIPGWVTNFGNYVFANCTNLTSVFFGSNAPGISSGGLPYNPSIFLNDSNATAYYLPGTVGWGSTVAGIPTVLLPYLYTAASGTITVRGYAGPGGTLTIPDTIGGLPVTSIGDEAFYNCGSLTGVTIPDSVTNIGHGAFAFCGNLTSVTIPDNLAGIGICAFWNCTNLASVTMGTNAASIGISEFDSCASLTSLIIPDSVTSIGSSALQNCSSLTNVTIGKNVASIGRCAFAACTSLTAIAVDPLNFNYGSVDDVLVNKSQNTLVQCPGGKAGNYTIPNNITSIGNFAFDSCASLTGITITNSITSIPDWAFDACSSLSSLTMPNITYIGSYAFESCNSLTNILILNGGGTIGYHIFDDCANLIAVTIGYNLQLPSPSAISSFSDCPSLTSIYLGGYTPVFAWNPTNEIATPTAYYLPVNGQPAVTTNYISGLPMALWLPRVQTGDASFGIQTNQFGFNITWAGGWRVVVEACTNLADPVWTAVGNNTIGSGGSSYFSDSQWTNYPSRFYRLRWP